MSTPAKIIFCSVVASVVLALTGIAIGVVKSRHSTSATAQRVTTVTVQAPASVLDNPESTMTTTTTKPKPKGPPTSFGEGSYKVGIDVAAGSYHTPGGTDYCSCCSTRRVCGGSGVG